MVCRYCPLAYSELANNEIKTSLNTRGMLEACCAGTQQAYARAYLTVNGAAGSAG